MKVYSASRGASYALVFDGTFQRQLDPRLDLRNHSPTGFAHGYFGSGPSQLALALLADALADHERALRLYMQFKTEFVARWPQDDGWTIAEDFIRAWADKVELDACSAADAGPCGFPPEHLEEPS